MAKVANPAFPAVPHGPSKGRSSRSPEGVAGPPSSPLSFIQVESGRPAALRTFRPHTTAPHHHIVPPGPVTGSLAGGLPDLAEHLARAGLDVPAALLQSHAAAMNALIAADQGPIHPNLAVQAAFSLNAVYEAFLDRLPAGLAASDPAFQTVASSFMAHALLINEVDRSGRSPADTGAFISGTASMPPSRLGASLSRSRSG